MVRVWERVVGGMVMDWALPSTEDVHIRWVHTTDRNKRNSLVVMVCSL